MRSMSGSGRRLARWRQRGEWGKPFGLLKPWDQTRLRTMRNQTTPTRDAVITTASAVYPFVAATQTATATIAMRGVYSHP